MTHLINKLAEAVDGAVRVVGQPDALVLYGSRARTTARFTSDWDFVAFFDMTKPFEERIVTPAFDILKISWRTTEQPAWQKREICALLMSDRCSLWLDPSKKPGWTVDWPAIIAEKERRVRNAIRLYSTHRNWTSLEIKKKQLLRIRRWAQRVEIMQAQHDIPSTPEIDAAWKNYSWSARDTLITRFGGDRALCSDIDQYT